MLSNKFIKATNEYCTYDKHVPAPYMRKTFEVKDTSKGEITISGQGFYRLFINGKEITKSFLAPYIKPAAVAITANATPTPIAAPLCDFFSPEIFVDAFGFAWYACGCFIKSAKTCELPKLTEPTAII